MKIVILGAGQVGSSVARSLAKEQYDVVVVDTDTEALDSLSQHLDLQTVVGHASHPDVLRQAGLDSADLLVAVTNSDETNIVACEIAHHLFHVPKKIARIRSRAYLRHKEALFHYDAFPVDVVISPEQVVKDYIVRLIEHPGALQVLDFADGKVQLVAVRAYYGGPMVGHAISELKQHMPTVDTRVAAIFRRGHPIQPKGDTVIEAEDEVFFLATPHHIQNVMRELQRLEHPYRSIMIAGGGHVGAGLAMTLKHSHQVKLIEHSVHRVAALAEMLGDTVVLCGDATDQELLRAENIEQMDVFIAVTNNDAVNILSAMLAKRLGARKTMALINHTEYSDLIHEGDIDVTFSPRQTTVGSLLTHIRRGDVACVYSLRKEAAEAIETVVHGDETTSKVVGKRIDEVPLPPGTTIGAIVRGDTVLMAHDNIVIQSGDHVILFIVEKSVVQEVEALFQVDATFV